MNENKNESIPGLSPQNIKKDIVMFKEDILRDMKGIQRSLDDKYLKTEDNLVSRLNIFENKIKAFEQKIFSLSNKISTDNKLIENVDNLLKYKEETSDALFKRRAKFNEFEKRMNEEINRINDILIDSVIYPGIIGSKCKFKTFHELVDYLIEEIGQFQVYKDKTGLDLGPFKKKIDQSIEAFKIQMNNIGNISKEFTTSSIEQSEERMKSILKIYDDRIQDARVDSTRNNLGLEKKAEELKKDLNNLFKAQKDLAKKFDRQIHENNNFEETINYYNNELVELNNKINKMNYILKELLTLNGGFKEKDKKGKIYSGVKQYIKGALNADQLTTMKSFKKYDNSSFGEDIKHIPTEFIKRQAFSKNEINISNSLNTIYEPKKHSSKKNLIYNYLNNSENHFDESNEKSNNKIHEVRDIYKVLNRQKNDIKKDFSRRRSYNYSTNKRDFKNYKISDDDENNNIIRNTEKKDIPEKEKENVQIRNSGIKIKKNLMGLNNSLSSNDSKKGSELKLNQDSKNDNISRKSSKKNHFIIKEEDENNMSDNSFFKKKEEATRKNEKKISNRDNTKAKNEKLENKIENTKLNNNNKNIELIKKDLIEERINDSMNMKPYCNTDINNNSNSNYNFKIGLNSLKEDSKYRKNVPLLEILKYSQNEENKKRCQSSKKNIIKNMKVMNMNKNLNILNKNNNKNIKNYDNSYSHSNIKNNNNFQINPKLPYLKTDTSRDNMPNSAKRKIKCDSNNKNNNVSQTVNIYKNYNYNKPKVQLAYNTNIFSNTIIAKKNKKAKNNLLGVGYERAKEAKELESLFNKLNSYIPKY